MGYFGSKRSFIIAGLGLLAVFLISQFQNCADQSTFQRGGVTASSTCTNCGPFVTPGTDPNAGGTGAPVVTTVNKTGTVTSNFNCPPDTVIAKVQGAGPTPVACQGVNIPNRTPSTCNSDADFTSNLVDWTYDAASDTWTNTIVLANNPIYVPGTYYLSFRKVISGPTGQGQFTIVRSDGGDPTNCLVSSTGPTPTTSTLPNCANHGSVGSFATTADLQNYLNQLPSSNSMSSFCVTLNGITVQTGFGPCLKQVCN